MTEAKFTPGPREVMPWSPNAKQLEQLAKHAGMEVDLMHQGAASLVYSFGTAGVTLGDLRRFAERAALASQEKS